MRSHLLSTTTEGLFQFLCSHSRSEICHIRVIAPSKAWERGNPCERMKPFEGVQLVKVQSGQSRSGQAGSESCLSPGDRRERSVDSEEAGREGSAPKFMSSRMPRFLFRPKAVSGQPSREDVWSRRSLWPGARFHRDSPGTWESLAVSSVPDHGEEVTGGRGQPETAGDGLRGIL